MKRIGSWTSGAEFRLIPVYLACKNDNEILAVTDVLMLNSFNPYTFVALVDKVNVGQNRKLEIIFRNGTNRICNSWLIPQIRPGALFGAVLPAI